MRCNILHHIIGNVERFALCLLTQNSDTSFKIKLRTKDGFSNPDNDPRGEWRLSNIKSTVERAQDKFSITDPETGRIFENFWAFSEASLKRMIEEGRIIFPKNEFLTSLIFWVRRAGQVSHLRYKFSVSTRYWWAK